MVFARNEQRFIERMAKKRIAQGWSQNEMARQLQTIGINWKQPTVARVEDGSRPLRFAEAMAIASFFGETIESMSAPETTTRWNVLVRLAAEAMLGEELAFRHFQTQEIELELLKIYNDPSGQRKEAWNLRDGLPKAAVLWLDWLNECPTSQAAHSIHDLDTNLYEAATEEARRIAVRSIHEVEIPDPNDSSS